MSEIKATREPYEPPIIEDVPLRSDEQVLQACKTSGMSGPGPFQCFNKPGNPCQTPGGS